MHLSEMRKILTLYIMIGVVSGSFSNASNLEDIKKIVLDRMEITEYTHKLDIYSSMQQLIMLKEEEDTDTNTEIFYTFEKISAYILNEKLSTDQKSINSTIKNHINWFKSLLFTEKHNVCGIKILSDIEKEKASKNSRSYLSTSENRGLTDENNYLIAKSLYIKNKNEEKAVLLAKIFEYSKSNKIYQIIDKTAEMEQTDFTERASFLTKRLKKYMNRSKVDKPSIKYYVVFLKTLFKKLKETIHCKDKKTKSKQVEEAVLILKDDIKQIVDYFENIFLDITAPKNPFFIMAMPTYAMKKVIITILDEFTAIKKIVYTDFIANLKYLFNSEANADFDKKFNEFEKSIDLLTDLQEKVDSITVVTTLSDRHFDNVLLFKL